MFKKLKESYKQTVDETQTVMDKNTHLVNGLSRGLLHSILLIFKYVFKYCATVVLFMFSIRSVMSHNSDLAQNLYNVYSLFLILAILSILFKIVISFVRNRYDSFDSGIRQNILLFVGLLISVRNVIPFEKLNAYSYLDLTAMLFLITVLYVVTNFGVNALLLNRFNTDKDGAFDVESYTVTYDRSTTYATEVKVARIKTLYVERFSLGFVTTEKYIELRPDEDLVPVQEVYLNDMMDTIDTVYQNLDKLPKVNVESKPQKSDDPNHLHSLHFSKVQDVNESELESKSNIVPFKLKRSTDVENESGESHDTNE